MVYLWKEQKNKGINRILGNTKMAFSKRNVELSPKLKLGVGRASNKAKVLKLTGVFLLIIAGVLFAHAIQLVTSNKSKGQVLGASDTRSASSDSGQLQFVEYKVQKGDTLFNISQQFNVPWNTLATLNNIQNVSSLKVGQILKIPKQ